MVAIIVISIIVMLIILVLSIAAISKGYSYKHTVDTYNYDDTPQTPPHLKNKDEKEL
ncbi:YtzI protein [Bacillus taeanensis]|uniref:YtzI protein n=1 Tax=Bacillus taeanensis TaxID=273032 RepID=A0A366Y0D3_9BACI|nr:YtzI protein [Bacillus taeanensis]RBW69621.1 YtzI protein [Bacillus taeanensis]